MFYWMPNIFKALLGILVAISGYLTYCKLKSDVSIKKKKKRPIRVQEKEEDYGTPVAHV